MQKFTKASTSKPRDHFGLFKTKKLLKCVGVLGHGYNLERVSYGIPIPGYEFRRVFRFPYYHLERKGTFWHHTSLVMDRSLNLYHTWNSLTFNGNFVLSFENELPRYLGKPCPWQLKIGFDILASKRCKKILGFNETTCTLAKERLREEHLEEIAKKIEVFRGALPYCVAEFNEKREEQVLNRNELKVIFVGTDVYGKGIIPAIRAIEKLRSMGLNIVFTIIGDFNQRAKILKQVRPLEWVEKISRCAWIKHYNHLPNKTVCEEMKKNDLLVLPTFDESGSWVIAEAGLSGLPALTTNVFALPELVSHKETGIIIDLDLGYQKRWKGIWLEGKGFEIELEKAYEKIENGIIEALTYLHNNRQMIIQLGLAAQRRFQERYDPEVAGLKLKKIYDEAIEK